MLSARCQRRQRSDIMPPRRPAESYRAHPRKRKSRPNRTASGARAGSLTVYAATSVSSRADLGDAPPPQPPVIDPDHDAVEPLRDFRPAARHGAEQHAAPDCGARSRNVAMAVRQKARYEERRRRRPSRFTAPATAAAVAYSRPGSAFISMLTRQIEFGCKRQCLFQRRYPFAGESRTEPAAGIASADRREGLARHQSGAVGRAVEAGVVAQHQSRRRRSAARRIRPSRSRAPWRRAAPPACFPAPAPPRRDAR